MHFSHHVNLYLWILLVNKLLLVNRKLPVQKNLVPFPTNSICSCLELPIEVSFTWTHTFFNGLWNSPPPISLGASLVYYSWLYITTVSNSSLVVVHMACKPILLTSCCCESVAPQNGNSHICLICSRSLVWDQEELQLPLGSGDNYVYLLYWPLVNKGASKSSFFCWESSINGSMIALNYWNNMSFV